MHKNSITLFIFTFFAFNLSGQDTVTRVYRPWVHERVYTSQASLKRKSSILKLVDISGNTRFVGQVWSDLGTFNGTTKKYYRNGKLKELKMYAPEMANGMPLKTGTWIFYRKDGSVKKEVVYKSGKKQK